MPSAAAVTAARSRKSAKLTRAELRRQTRRLDCSLEGQRWKLAYLALGACKSGIGEYALIMGLETRREPRTIVEWKQTAEFRRTIQRYSKKIELPFSWWAFASRFLTRVDIEDILENMLLYSREKEKGFSSFQAQFITLANEPEGDPPQVRRSLTALVKKANGLRTTFGVQREVAACVLQAEGWLEAAQRLVG